METCNARAPMRRARSNLVMDMDMGTTGGRPYQGTSIKVSVARRVSFLAPQANTLMRELSRAAAEDTPMPAAKPAAKAIKGYCVKCRTKRDIKDAKKVTLKNGKPALKGKCPVCGTGMFRIGGG